MNTKRHFLDTSGRFTFNSILNLSTDEQKRNNRGLLTLVNNWAALYTGTQSFMNTLPHLLTHKL